jgi:TonB family protein
MFGVIAWDLMLLKREMRLSSGISTATPTCLLALLLLAAMLYNLGAQQSSSSSIVSYPDTQDGLEHFAKDLLKAHKQGNQPDEVRRLVQSLALPNLRAWFSTVFGERAYEPLAQAYFTNQAALLQQVDAAVVVAAREGFSEIRAKKYEKSCDDSAGELTFPLLMARITPVPLYELRMMGASSFRRISIFAYVDGTFRYVGPLNISDEFAPAKDVKPPARIQLKGDVQAAKNRKKVAPSYPDAARREGLEGTVRLHAIIGTDGSVQQVRVIRGYCSLSEVSLPAVKQWRYTPTLLNGEPVEVDTTIDVIFALRRR